MKKIKVLIFFILGMVSASIITVGAYKITGKNIKLFNNNWNVSNVSDALDYLKDENSCKGLNPKFATLIAAAHDKTPDLYAIDPGDGIVRNFYVLEDKGDTVDLLMDRNITLGTSTTTMSWNDAMAYIDNNNLKSKWKKVINVDLPSAQAIVNASGNSSWNVESHHESTWWCFASKGQDSNSAPYCNTDQAKAYNWLYDYTRECNGCSNSQLSSEAYGYWTRDAINETTISHAWRIDRRGNFDYDNISETGRDGVRPVITVKKSSLQ